MSDKYTMTYDEEHEILRLTFKPSGDFTYEEVFPNVYLRLDDNTGEVIGLQVIGVEHLKNK